MSPLAQKVLRAEPHSAAKGLNPLPRVENVARPDDWQWLYADAVRSRMSGDGKISTLCVPERPTVAGLRPDALLA